MARKRHDDEVAFGSDSFLDVVCNLVGILIILVVVAGLRTQKIHSKPAEIGSDAVASLEQARKVTNSLEEETLRLDRERQTLQLTAAQRRAERDVLAHALAHGRHAVDERLKSLDGATRERVELESRLAAAQSRLKSIEAETAQADSGGAPQRIEVESFPTPLSQTVFGKEEHFQLRERRIVHVPLDLLIEKFKAEAPHQAGRLQRESDLTDTVGPIGGFRLRYTLERVDIPVQVQLNTGRAGSYAQLVEYTLIPTSSRLGETLDEALGERSQFRTALVGREPKRTTITLWTYPDSFAEYRALKKELYEKGYQVAARPLPEGFPIGGSPSGSKSAAQ